MTAVINFTPLFGVEEDEPFCYLLQIDEFHLLLDCGWDERFDEKMLQPLKQVIDKVDAVLISHPDLSHLGALPYACGKLGLNVPIYATEPVCKMGQMFMYDACQTQAKFKMDIFDLDDVDTAFDRMKQLKYSQDVALSDKGEGIIITAYNAGHMLGGSIWKITKETEEIIYAVEFNHARERHLNPVVLTQCTTRPTVLITDAFNALTSHKIRKERDKEFIEGTVETIRNGGNVLIPCDAAGRVLEMLLLMHSYWAKFKFGKGTYSLAFLSPVSYNTVDFARSQIEWMSKSCMQHIDNRENPFAFKDLHTCHSKADLNKLKRPFVCFATSGTMESSLAQDLLLDLASNPRNTVFLTHRHPSWALSSKLLKAAQTAKALGGDGRIDFLRRKNVLLEGEELEVYLEDERLKQEQKDLEQHAELSEDSESGDDDEDMDAGVVVRRVQLVPKYMMYPCAEKTRTWDVYGETINPADFKVADPESVIKGPDLMADDIMEPEVKGPPTKTISEHVRIDLRAKVKYIDFEGRSDGRSLPKLIAQIKPRKVILVRGSAAAKEKLTGDLKKTLKDQSLPVVLPLTGQCVDITSAETNVFRVNLKEKFTHSLDFVKIGDYEIAYAEGQVKIDYEESPLPVLNVVPPTLKQGHAAVLLGNLKLGELKNVLMRQGFEVELINQVVVCNGGIVQVHRTADNQISIRGSLCEEYFKIREILYGLYEII